MDATDQERILIITGMHRSGTSLVAGMFERAGVDIGSELVEPDDGNPHGYHEDKGFVEFHDGLLSRCEQRVFVQRRSDLQAPTAEDVDRARQLIGERRSRGLWGFKDPRTSLFLDFWSKLLPQARFVFLLRHPIDVVASLLRRGSDAELEVRVDPLAGLRSWQVYNGAIMSFFARQPERCLLCDIYRVVEDPETLIRVAGEKLGLPLRAGGLEELIHRGDLHATYSSPRVDTILQRAAPQVASLYREMASTAGPAGPGLGRSGDEDPQLAVRLDAIAGLLRDQSLERVASRPLLAAALACLDPETSLLSGGELRSRLSRAETQLDGLQAHCHNLEQIRRRDRGRIVELASHGENLEAELGRRQSALEGLSAHVENLEAGRERDQTWILELSRHAENLGQAVDRLQAVVADLKAHTGNLEADRGRDRELIEELSRHADNLESQRATLQEQLSGRDAELARFYALFASQLRESERFSTLLEQVSPSLWVRPAHRADV